MRRVRLALLVSSGALWLAPACGDDGGGGGGDDDPTIDADTTMPDAPDMTGWTPLIARSWTIPAGDEIYRCVRIQVEQDMYINGFRSLTPTGEHHTVLTVKDSLGGIGGNQTGEYNCDAGTLDLQMLYASGVTTADLEFPEGVGMKLTAGQYINLNLHLFNSQAEGDLSGESTIYVKLIDESELVNEAEFVFCGDGSLNIPGNTNGTPHMETGSHTFGDSATIVSYWPHMHQFAVRQKVEVTIDGETTVLHDEPYSFLEQNNYSLEPPLQVSAGDSIRVECYYENDTGTPITFGDSSEREMCFTGLYRYPKQALHLFECTANFGGL